MRSGEFATKLTTDRAMPPSSCTPDEVAIWRLARREILVDVDLGFVYRANGVTRAEAPKPNGYGIVTLGRPHGRLRVAQAHRIVWIAEHGPIPGMYEINHRNGLRWDNRIANLDLVTHTGNMRHAHLRPYEHIPGKPFLGPEDRDEEPQAFVAMGRSKRHQHRYD